MGGSKKINEAIGLLEKQKQKIGELTSDIFPSWKTHTLSLIKEFLGENSTEYIGFLDAKFIIVLDVVHNHWGNEYKTALNSKYLSDYIDNCIAKIRINKKLFEVPEHPFIDGLKNKDLRKWAITVALSTLVLGYILGAYNNPKAVLMQMIKEKLHLP
jgi:hypothetical protein